MHDSQSRFTDAVDATKSLLHKGHHEGLTHHKSRNRHGRSYSGRSETSLALEELENILAKSMTFDGNRVTTPKEDGRGSYFPRHGSTRRRTLRRNSTVASSDTDYHDGDTLVPSAEVVLDNSKTLGYSGGTVESQIDLLNPSKRSLRDKEAWLHFKKVCLLSTVLCVDLLPKLSGLLIFWKEIVRLANTLRLKGWRLVPLEFGGEIEVERLSGALTNAVYVVSPPKVLPQTALDPQNSSALLVRKKSPP